MLGPIKNHKEINKSLSSLQQENLNKKEKLNKIKKLNSLKKIDNKNIKYNFFNTSFITQQMNKTKNKSIDNINDSIFKNRKSIGFPNKNFLNKKNILKPINQKMLYKVNTTPQLLRSDTKNNIKNINNNNFFSSKKSFTKISNTRNNKLETLKKQLNNSYNSFNVLNSKNNTIFNSTKDNNTNYFFSNDGTNFFISSYDNNFSKTKISKNKKRFFSKFFYKSQSKLISSKKIYNHYIKEDEKDKIKPVKFYFKGSAPRSIKELKECYKEDIQFERRMRELKCNNTIAFKDDFNILDYQTTLITLLSKRISEKNLHDLQKKFVLFNEKNFGIVGPKGRFTNMAEKIKYNIPLYLYEKIKKLDTDKLISKYNYYKRINQNISKKFRKKYEIKKNKKKDIDVDSSKVDLVKKINNNSF
jgi:hypothetical protein